MWKTAFALSCLVIASADAAADCSVRMSGRSPAPGSTICIYTNNYPDDTHMISAAERWNNECGGGDSIPALTVGGCSGAPIVIDVIYLDEISTNGSKTCGEFRPSTNGNLTGGTVKIWKYGQYESGPETGTLYPCSVQAIDTLTHELGHVLGLANADGSACYGHIMGARMTEDRTIFADDCAELNQLWNTAAEQQATCDRYCWTTCENGVCPPQPTTTTPHPTITPILIDLDQNGFHLAGLDAAVIFDIDADGKSDRISWTGVGTGDAFLVFDRNGNGQIDDGRELFGNATLLASGAAAPNGYEALIELDNAAFGGDEDSFLTARDAAWELLQVWIDADHNAVADPGELASLAAAGVMRLDTRYKRANRTDAYGNLFRFRSSAMVRNAIGRKRAAMTYDVFFVDAHDVTP